MPAPEGEYAGGGIVAFAGDDGSLVEGEDEAAAFANNQIAIEDLMPSPGDPRTHADLVRMLGPSIRNIRNQEYTPYTTADRQEAVTAARKTLQEGAGDDPTTAYAQQLDQFDTERKKGMDQASGFGLLAAAGDMLQPGGGGVVAGIGRAAKTYGGAMQQAVAADKAEKRSLMNMKFQLADAQRKERMGLTRDALSLAQQAQKSHYDAQVFKQKRLIAEGKLVSEGVRATRPTGMGGAGGNKPPKGIDAMAAAAYEYKRNPTPENKMRLESYQDAFDAAGRIPGSRAGDLRELPSETSQGKDINEAMQKWELLNPDAIIAKKNDPKKFEALKKAKRTELEGSYPSRSKDGNKKASETEKGGKVATQADIDATVAKSGRSEAEVRAALKAQGYTIK